MTNECKTRLVHRELYNVKSLPNREEEKEKKGRKTHISLRALFNWVKWKLTSSDGEFVSSNHEFIQLCVSSSYSVSSNIHVNRCQTHWSLALRLTLYKFIVMDPLGLDPIHLWAQSENHGPTYKYIVMKVSFKLFLWHSFKFTSNILFFQRIINNQQYRSD